MPTIYPGSVFTPLFGHSEPGTLAQRKLIVLHDTEGPTAAGAINTFRTSVHPNRTSCTFVIDRNTTATVYQLLDVSDTAWHASQVNSISVGIEHVGLSAQGAIDLNAKHHVTTFKELLATEAQYYASAKLLAWLCRLLKLPCDRVHIQPHSQCSPADHHAGCCQAVLDPDRVVQIAAGLVSSIS